MADLNPKIQIIMLTASRLNIQLKRDCEARNKKKKKDQLSTVYKRWTLNIKT